MKQDNPKIPQVEKLIQNPQLKVWEKEISRHLLIKSIRTVLDEIRTEWKLTGATVTEAEILNRIDGACDTLYRSRPLPVINCSGVLIHTNLGRAPLDASVWDAVKKANTRYVALEYDMIQGKRGQRNALLSPLFSALTGAESAAVVNNNAAALFLILSMYAKNREVIVSRGELVQIGGGFRIPEILEQSGARLVEVGTTNVTTCEDYTRAITQNTALVLKVHRSNFALRGFTCEPTTRELVEALPGRIMVLVDQGSGVLDHEIPGEVSVKEHLAHGASIVTFSGDKVLGSVQSGCIVGKETLVAPLITHPLYRVLRPGKTIVTLLEQTLINQLNGQLSSPMRMAQRSIDELRVMGKKIISGLPSAQVALVEAPMTLGGGSTPDEFIPSLAIKVTSHNSIDVLVQKLRSTNPPVIGKVEKNSLMLYLGALDNQDAEILSHHLSVALEDV